MYKSIRVVLYIKRLCIDAKVHVRMRATFAFHVYPPYRPPLRCKDMQV